MIWPKSSQHWDEIGRGWDDLGPEDSPRTVAARPRAGRVARGDKIGRGTAAAQIILVPADFILALG